jgi:SPP1 family predicted phage head-tail adaptor
LRIGELRERLVIESLTGATDAEGESIKTWATSTTVWGRAEFLSGRELEAMQKVHAEAVVRFTVRYNSAITAAMRVSWRSGYWLIHAALPDERKTVTILLASKTAVA